MNTLYTDGKEFVAFGLDAIAVFGPEPHSPSISMHATSGYICIARFAESDKENVFDAMRSRHRALTKTLEEMQAAGWIEASGEPSGVLCEVKRLKVSVEEFIDVQLKSWGLSMSDLTTLSDVDYASPVK